MRGQVLNQGMPFTITAVREDGPRYVLEVVLSNPESGDDEDRLLSFPIGSGVESRDKMLKRLKEHLEREDAEEVTARLEKVGRSYVLVPV